MPTPARTLVALTVAVMTAFDPSAVGAQDGPNHLYDRYQLSVSGTALFFGTKIRVDPENGEGTEITFEDELGVDKVSLQPRAALRWRFGRRHEIEGGYVRASRSNERVLTDTIVFRDTSFAAGLRVASTLGTSQAFVAYRYTFNAKDNTQVGMGLGLGVIFLRSELEAVAGATSGGQDTAITRFSRAGDMNGPTASLGLFGRFLLSDRWYLESEARALYIKVDNFRAGVVELDVAGRYFLSSSVGLELGYSLGAYGIRLDHTGSGEGAFGIDLMGKVTYTVQGLRGGVVFAF